MTVHWQAQKLLLVGFVPVRDEVHNTWKNRTLEVRPKFDGQAGMHT